MSYIIVFKNRFKVQVSESVGNSLKQIYKEGKDGAFEIDGNMYTIKGIDMILKKADAFDAYPMEWEALKNMNDAPVAPDSLALTANN